MPNKSCMMDWPSSDHSAFAEFSRHQRDEYAKATTPGGGNLRLLTGRPGVGKSYCLARILKAIPGDRTAVVGPTGKSAVRITELMQKCGVDMRATTIHTLLGPGRDDDDNWRFEHDENNPLELDWIFVDEFSMVDTSLAASLLAAHDAGCKVLAIGDTNQLSPVGPGAPLRDLVAAGLPCGNLIEPRRNAGRIVRCCHGIVDKHQFEPSPRLDLAAESPENLLHVEKRDPEAQIETLKTMLDRFRQGAVIGERRIDPVWDVMTIVPVNEKSPLARVAINRVLQGFLNPGGEQIKESPFRVGDRIVNGKNGWLPVETNIPRGLKGGPWNQSAKDGKEYTANGETGRVLALFPRYTVARLESPDRIIRIPKGDSYQDEDGETQDTGCQWELGYAVSCHKSQGSQWPVVITMADAYPGARMLCDRCWLYTALSRAEIMAATIGQREVLDDMCRKSHIWARKTFLKESILELQQQSAVRGWEEALI